MEGTTRLLDAVYGQRARPEDTVRWILHGPVPPPSASGDRSVLPRLRGSLATARLCARTLATVRGDRVDLVHCAGGLSAGLAGLAVHRVLGTPYLVWLHGSEVSMALRTPVARRMMTRVLTHARAVIVPSAFTHGLALEAGAPEGRLHRVHPGVDLGRLTGPLDTTDLVHRWGLADKRVLLSVGRLLRRKGHDVVLQALARLRLRDVVYLVLSDGPMAGELRALADTLGLTDTVRWVGTVPDRDLPRYHHAADVFALANRTLEDGDVSGFGLSFLEAAAAGRAVVGGRGGGTGDAVADGETGLLVDGASVTDVADALWDLLEHPAKRTRLGDQGQTRAREFPWEDVATRVHALVTDAMTHG